MLVLLATQGQCYVTNERTGARHQLTGARLGSFCKGATGDALTPPWSLSPLQDYDARGRAAIVSLMACDDFLQLVRRDMVRLEPWGASRMGMLAGHNISGSWDDVLPVWRMVEPVVGHSHSREALSAALRLGGFRGEGRDAAADCFRERAYARMLAEAVGRDRTRDLVRGYLDKAFRHHDLTGFLSQLVWAFRMLDYRGIELDHRRACEHALAMLDLPAATRHGRSYNVQLWSDSLIAQMEVRGRVEDRYPRDPHALMAELEHERELRRHEASDSAITARAEALSGNSYESDGYLIRPAASVQEILDEANAQSNCVASFIDKYAAGRTDLWLMRDADDPDTPLVTVEVRDGAVRQAFQSHNRQITASQRAFLKEWCEAVGYRTHEGRMRALGA